MSIVHLSPGDHLSIDRGVYTHHGIYVGEGAVIHFTGELKDRDNAAIRRTSLAEFLSGQPASDLELVSYGDCFAGREVVRRAESRVGEDGYRVFDNNCEHFARWCKTGRAKSEQVKDAAAGAAGTAGATAAAAGSLGVVSGVGAAAGLSGPGIMSGLATVGSTVGAGAVGGVVVLGAAPAAAATLAMRKALEDDPSLPQEERDARAAGRTATAVGAAGGAVGSVAAISSAGTVAGLSGPGIASGLAAIGSGLGGGMAAGTVVAVAAPAVVAAAAGYGIYRTCKWLLG